MNSTRQLLVALSLAGAVVAIVVRETMVSDHASGLVEHARVRSSAQAPSSTGVESAAGGAVAGGAPELTDGLASLGRQLDEMPLVQLLTLLAGGSFGLAADQGGAAGDSPNQDWAFVEQTDSMLQHSGIGQLAERMFGIGAAGN
jgi:hypothetical protein